ncbi:hypothetical protein BHM03_00062203 [Ensete ventricosum]|nr:hypothetical protein BHM03_00062203 [Ensete ventricosum]
MQSRVSISFSYIVSEIQNTGHSRRISHGKSYEHDFGKKYVLAHGKRRVEFRSIFRVRSKKFKIMALLDVLALGKPYENGFAKKCDGQKHCAKSHAESSFDRFFMHHLKNSKYWPFPMY